MSPNLPPAVPAPSSLPLNVASAARILLVMVGTTLLVQKGILSSDQLQTVVAALLILGAAVWNWWKNRSVTGKLTAAMTAAPVRLASILLAVCFVLLAAPGLTACGTIGGGAPTVATVQQTSEKLMIEADDLYIAIATGINAAELASPGQEAKLEAIKVKAWNDLLAVRRAYAVGTVLTAATLAALQADSTTATSSGATVAPAAQ